MTGFRLLPRSLFAKLGLYFVALSLPALLLVESSVIWFEFREFSASVDRGAMQAEVGAARPRFARIVQHESGDRARLDDALASWLLRLERPRIGIGAQNSYVLLELASEPLSAAIFGATPLAWRRTGPCFKRSAARACSGSPAPTRPTTCAATPSHSAMARRHHCWCWNCGYPCRGSG
jgi:hypothetical protein